MEKAIIEQCIYNHMPLPSNIANAPELLQGLSLFYRAFMDLTTCRTLTESSEGPISWLAIDAYCRHHAIVDEQREDMETIIPMMDIEYIRKCRELRKQAVKNAT